MMVKLPDMIMADGFPVSLVFSKSGRVFFSERVTGNLWEVLGEEKYRLVKHFSVVPVTGHHETGLLGIALDPDFESNDLIYCFYTTGADIDHCENKVVCIDTQGLDKHTVIDKLPAARTHDGGIIAFGSDGKLYIGLGVQNEIMAKSQDLKHLGGKVLRINTDGSIPSDNPFSGSPVYTYGHRNLFGFAVQQETGKMFVSEAGPDRDDEINILEAGGNYGWPEVTGVAINKKYIDPIITFTPTITPTQCAFYKSNFYFGSYNEGTVHQLTFAEDQKTIKSDKIVYRGKSFGVIGVFVSPSGEFFVSTPNRILRIDTPGT